MIAMERTSVPVRLVRSGRETFINYEVPNFLGCWPVQLLEGAESIALEEDFMRRFTRHKQSSRIQDIVDALTASGYKTLDEQAKALGLNRATAWTIIKNKHKLGRLSAKTIQRILSNSETPQAVRAVIQKYMAERSAAVEVRRSEDLSSR
jgi:hypothetical protein